METADRVQIENVSKVLLFIIDAVKISGGVGVPEWKLLRETSRFYPSVNAPQFHIYTNTLVRLGHIERKGDTYTAV